MVSFLQSLSQSVVIPQFEILSPQGSTQTFVGLLNPLRDEVEENTGTQVRPESTNRCFSKEMSVGTTGFVPMVSKPLSNRSKAKLM